MDTGDIRNAKIVCTLGPASNDRDTIEALADAGMSVARINASHGTREDRAELVETVKAVDESTEHTVATMLDTQGPEIRTGDVSGPTVLEQGTEVRLAPGEHADAQEIGLSVSLDGVDVGDTVLIDDGRIQTTVVEVTDDAVIARVDSGGELESRRGVNVPGVNLDVPAVTEADEKDLEFAVKQDVDLVAASFVRNREDVFTVRETIEDAGGEIPIVAKIERADAVKNLEGIVDAAYGAMVARGDLGVECPLEDVPIFQKRIIRTCNRAGVPVITATEMLDSMIHERRPTRAEASDVANAVLDGTDAVMLSAETAIGDHPVRVVDTMDRIVRDVEQSAEYDEIREQRVPPAGETQTDALARSGRFLARDVGATALVAASESGYTARKASQYRPTIPIVAATASDAVRRRLALSWGIIPVSTSFDADSADALIKESVGAALDTDVAEGGDTLVVMSGLMTGVEALDTANMLKVHVAAERVASGRTVVGGRVTGPLHRVEDGDLSDVPDGAVLSVPADFEGEFDGEAARMGGIVDAHEGVTSYAAIVARELDLPMIADTSVPDDLANGTSVTIDGERGVLYADAVDPAVDESPSN